MTLPRIHDNGTSPQRLAEGYESAYTAVQLAYQALKSTAPNPRDYGPDELPRAEREHAERLARLEMTMGELDALARHCLDHATP